LKGGGERRGTRRVAQRRRSGAGRPADSAPRQAELACPTVLIVDDADAIRDFLRSALEAEGYNVLAAGDGVHALALCERYQVDAILLDLMMPRLDGPGFLARLRQRQGRDGTSVFLMSAMSSAVEYAFAEGVAGAFVKPFDLDELIDTLRAAVPPRPASRLEAQPPTPRPATSRSASTR
jgi:CheY-like chemotaxis protein